MRLVKVAWQKRPLRAAEWKDVEKIVNRHLKKYKKFYEELAEL
jgi:hypothetical protein